MSKKCGTALPLLIALLHRWCVYACVSVHMSDRLPSYLFACQSCDDHITVLSDVRVRRQSFRKQLSGSVRHRLPVNQAGQCKFQGLRHLSIICQVCRHKSSSTSSIRPVRSGANQRIHTGPNNCHTLLYYIESTDEVALYKFQQRPYAETSGSGKAIDPSRNA